MKFVKVRRGKDYYYVNVNNKKHNLNINGSTGENVIIDFEGQYTIIDGQKYYLDWN